MTLEFRTHDIDRETYLAGLNTCFSGWGDEAQYAWCFERDSGAGAADLMLATDGEVVGGSAVVYRRASNPAGVMATVAIMCGSWTLPASRGQGCFTQMIQHSLALARKRGALHLLAFVTETNPSKRRLEAAGSLMLPTGYCVAVVEDVASELSTTAPQCQVHDSDFRFAYPENQAWEEQFMERQLPTRTVTLPSGATAVIESAPDTDRILTLGDSRQRMADLDALRREAATKGRKTFFFTSSTPELTQVTSIGFKVIPGFLTVLPTQETSSHAWAETDPTWFLEHGDRM